MTLAVDNHENDNEEQVLIDQAGHLKKWCNRHICSACPFGIVFKTSNGGEIDNCHLRGTPKNWTIETICADRR